MKKVGMILVLVFLFSGCGARETFETVGNVWQQENDIQLKQVVFTLPEEAAATAIASEAGSIWFCDGYEIMLQICSGGDLGRTVQQITGYSMEDLTCIQTMSAGVQRCECVWTAAGEDGDQVCRGIVLDDGVCHYVLSVMAPAREAGSLQQDWEALFASVSLQG